MSHHLPLYISLPTIFLFLIIAIISIVFYFKTFARKKRLIAANEQAKQKTKLKLYQEWGHILWFLIATIFIMGIIGILAMIVG